MSLKYEPSSDPLHMGALRRLVPSARAIIVMEYMGTSLIRNSHPPQGHHRA